MSFDLRQMGHVLAVDEHRSISRAAVALGLSQPALSRSIRAVEQQIGAEIFARSPSGVVPTDLGRLLVQRARQIVQLASDLDHEVLGNPALQSDYVRVGAGPYPAEALLRGALGLFLDAHPRVRVRVEVRDWDELVRRLRARELDFFMAEVSTLGREHDLEVEPLGEHALFFAARPGHPLAGRGSVAPAQTFAFPLVSPARIPPRVLAPMLKALGQATDPPAVTRPFPALEYNDLPAVIRIAKSSNAVTAVTLFTAAAELEAGELVLLGREPWMSVRYGFVSLRGQPPSGAAAHLRDLLAEAERAVSREEARLAVRFRLGAGGRRGRGSRRAHAPRGRG